MWYPTNKLGNLFLSFCLPFDFLSNTTLFDIRLHLCIFENQEARKRSVDCENFWKNVNGP